MNPKSDSQYSKQTPIHLSILGSTRGSNLQPLVDALNHSGLAAEVVLVLSNQPQAGILQRAAQYHLPQLCLPSAGLSREAHEAQLNQALTQARTNLVILLGYMRILTPVLLSVWHNKIINVHPSLLPKHKGLMDLAVHQAVLDDQDNKSGCSVHYVTEQVDEGEVIVQETCPVLADDTAQTLKQRVQALEVPAIMTAIRKISHENQT